MPARSFALRVLMPLHVVMAGIATWLLSQDPWWRARLGHGPVAVGGLFLLLLASYAFLTLLLHRVFQKELRQAQDLGTASLEDLQRTRARMDQWSGVVATALGVGLLLAFRVPPHLTCLAALPFLVVVLVQQDWRHTQMEVSLAHARDRALQTRLAPHFAFNTLSTLKDQVAEDPEEARLTIDRMAFLLREAMGLVNEVSIPLVREMAFVEAYLGLERARFGPRLQVVIEVDEQLEQVPVPPLALQILVENALHHGIARRPEGGILRITAASQGPWLQLTVEDPGSGEGGQAGMGQALAILRRRLGPSESLHLEPVPGVGHRAHLRLRRT